MFCHRVDSQGSEVSVDVLWESKGTTLTIPVACFSRVFKSLKHLLFAAQEWRFWGLPCSKLHFFFHVYCFLEAECHSDSLLIRSDVFGEYHALNCIYFFQVHYSLEVRTYFSKKQTGKRKEDEEENVHQYFICEQSTFSKQGSRPNIWPCLVFS